MNKPTISDKEMQEIFKNWNTPFGKLVRKLDNYIVDNMVYEKTDCGKLSPISWQVNYYLDGIITPLRFWHNIVSILGEMDYLHSNHDNTKIVYNSDDKKFINYMKRIKKMVFNNN